MWMYDRLHETYYLNKSGICLISDQKHLIILYSQHLYYFGDLSGDFNKQ